MAQPFHFRPARAYAPHGSASRRSPAPGPSGESSSAAAAAHHASGRGGQAAGQGAYGQHPGGPGQPGGEGMTYPMNGYGGGGYYYPPAAPGYGHGQGYDGPSGAGPSNGAMEGIVYPAVSPGPGSFDYGGSPAGGNAPGQAGPSRYQQYNPYYQQYYPSPQYGGPQPYYAPNPYPVYQPAVPYNQAQYTHPQHHQQQPYGYAYQSPYMPSHGPGPGGGGYPAGPGMGYPPYMAQQPQQPSQQQQGYVNGMSAPTSYPSSIQANVSEASGPTATAGTSVTDAPAQGTPGSVHMGLPAEKPAPNGKAVVAESPAQAGEDVTYSPADVAATQTAKPEAIAPTSRPISFGEIEVDTASAVPGPNGLKIGVGETKPAEQVLKPSDSGVVVEGPVEGKPEPAAVAQSEEKAVERTEEKAVEQREEPVKSAAPATEESSPAEVAAKAAPPAEESKAVPDDAVTAAEAETTESAADSQSFGEIAQADSDYMLSPARPSVSESTPSITLRLAASLPKSVTSAKAVYVQALGDVASAPAPERKRSKGKERQQRDRVAFPRRLARERRQAAQAAGGLVFGEGAESASAANEANAEPQALGESAPTEQAVAPSAPATATKDATASPAAPAKPVIKSWAALVRASAPPSPANQPGPATPGQSTAPPSGIASLASPPSGAAALPSVGQASTGTLSGAATPASRPGGYAAAAWGGAMRHQEDLGKLLLEGLDPRITTRTGRVGNVPRGIINTGNMCFANSILQVLAYCTPFTALFDELSKRVQADLGRKTPLVEAMFMFLREFTASNESTGLQPSALPHPNGASSSNARAGPSGTGGKREPFVPTYVYDAMRENKRFDSMRRGHQEDAEEFLGFFLETLHEELLYLHSRHISRTSRPPPVHAGSVQPNGHAEGDEEGREVNRPVSPSATADDGWLEVGKKQKINVVRNTESKESAVSRIFGGKLRSVLHTPGQKDSITLEPYQPLQLDISPASVHTITDALHHLHEPETIPGVFSSSRGVNVDATKQVFVETLPPILILHFKRFLYDAVEQKVVKKGKAVGYGTQMEVPSEIMSPGRKGSAPMTYRLFGVIYHHGSSASGGHYTAAVLHHNPPSSADPAHPSAGTTSWVHLDDETIEEVATDEVVVSKEQAAQGWNGEVGRAGRERCAYLLFYQRV